MKKKGLSTLILVSLIISMMSFAANGEVIKNQNTMDKNDHILEQSISHTINDPNFQDGRFIERLQWISPNGEMPGTYEDYLRNHPLEPALFSPLEDKINPTQPLGEQFAILVDEVLYPQITTAITQYIDDLELEGYSVVIETVHGGTPEEIKEWVAHQFDSGCDSFVFIGDITAAWAEVSGSVFPCDLFYMDLDGNWEDQDQDGDYETHTAGGGDMGPEVYVGRIYAHTLTYDTESNMVNDYLSKAHAYRNGTLIQEWCGLEYVEEDWYDMDVFLDLIYQGDVVRHDYGYFTTADDYLDKMDLGHHFVQVCAHSYSGGHHFSTRPTKSASYGHIYIYSPSSRSAKLLLGCDDGIKVWLNKDNIYTNDRYSGWVEDAYEVAVSLNEGWNQLLCKVSQEGGEYKLSARFTDTEYSSFGDLNYQINDPATHGPEAEYIRSWLLNGFHQDVPDNFWNYLITNYLGVDEGSINPLDGEVMGGKPWTTYDSGFPYIDMSDYDEHDYGVIYAFARIYADSETSCQLWLGYDDGARVWLNDQIVVYDNRYGEFEADMTRVNLTLRPGENRLLVKISEWMGDHGFSARVCQPDGSPVEGLTYDPESNPITHIGTWLLNGPYVNPDQKSRLSTDYLGNEGNATPSEGDPASFGTWERGIGNGCPFGIDTYFDQGDWVYSQDIQDRDPPVLFYNLFACGPGRFPDENYLAGAYIFNTTYGLITVASSKSGGMLNFDDFTAPLGEDKSIGEAFREWFEAQAPYAQWEKEWYYGMVVCGDPTLRVFPDAKTRVRITKPENAIYMGDTKILPFFEPVLIGKCIIEANATNQVVGIDRVEFYLDEVLKVNDSSDPYSWVWEETAFFTHSIKVVAYDNVGNSVSDEIKLWKFF